MDALYLDAENDLTCKTLPKPSITCANDVLIRVSYAGLCGTDLHIIAGDLPSAKNIVIGHEFVGTIEQMGENVTGFTLGDKV